MSATGRTAALATYRALLRAGQSYPDYNIRHFILRRAKEGFRDNRSVSAAEAARLLQEASSTLGLIHRQSTIAGFYAGEPSVMEYAEKAAAKKGGSKVAAPAAAAGGR